MEWIVPVFMALTVIYCFINNSEISNLKYRIKHLERYLDESS